MRRFVQFACLSGLLGLLLLAAPCQCVDDACAAAGGASAQQVASLQPAESASTDRDPHHPRHMVKVWLTTYRGRTFRVIQLPRCEHMEAVLAYNALGCRDYARVDFRLSPENEPFCLEVNTLPGMTELSLVPMAAREAGISFEELVERICQMALARAGT